MLQSTRRTIEPVAIGRVESLAVNGDRTNALAFLLDGPFGDRHSGFARRASGHDGGYMRTSALEKGDDIFNFRCWTALSREDISEIQRDLGHHIPPGCLLENLVISGVPNFSQLAPTSRLVFPVRDLGEMPSQAILAVWEENEPCKVVGKRLADYHHRPELERAFVSAAQHRRGVMGLALSPGRIEIGDEVFVYPPLQYGT